MTSLIVFDHATLGYGRRAVLSDISFDIPAGDGLTVSKAILNAGGFSDFSDKKHVRLIRKTAEGQQTHIVNVADVWEKSRIEEDLAVHPDDTIVVPARLLNY